MRKAATNPLKSRLAAAKARGLTLIETALTLAIMALVVASLASMMAENADKVRARAAADKITEVHEASQGYIKANYGALLAQTAGGPVVIPAGRASAAAGVPNPSLQRAGFLSPGFVDSNGYGQRHSLVVRRVTGNPNALEAIVTTHGGSQIPDRLLGSIANMVGAAGGYVPQTAVTAADNNQIVGSYGGWRTARTGWGSVSPTAGTIQTTLAFEDGQLLTDYLYRNDIGVPEANRMNTDIDMNANDLNNVATIRGNGGTLNVTGNLVASVDVWSRRDLRADRDVLSGRDVTASRNVAAQNNVTAGQDVSATRDVRAGRNMAATQDVTAGRNMSATQDVTAGRDASVGRNLRVTGNSTVNGNSTVGGLLTAARIDGSARIMGFSGFENAGATLNDLLPKTVAQYSYLVTPGQQVPKPTCRGGTGNARIMVYPQAESSRTAVTINGTTGSGGAGGNSHTHTFSNTFNVDTSVAVYATSNANTWTVNWTGNPAAPASERRAIAQTFCFYG